MNQTSYEKGRLEGKLELICSVLEKKFGSISHEVREAVATLSEQEAQTVLLKVGTVDSLSELGLPDRAEED